MTGLIMPLVGRAVETVTTPWVIAPLSATADEVSPADVNWTSPNNITAIDGTRASVTLSSGFPNSAMLMGYNFNNDFLGGGFTNMGIPTGATNIELEAELVNSICTAGATVTMMRVQEFSATPNVGAGNGAGDGRVVPGTGTDLAYKGGSAFWGVTINRALLVATNNNLAIVCRFAWSSGSAAIGVDAIRARVHYTP